MEHTSKYVTEESFELSLKYRRLAMVSLSKKSATVHYFLVYIFKYFF